MQSNVAKDLYHKFIFYLSNQTPKKTLNSPICIGPRKVKQNIFLNAKIYVFEVFDRFYVILNHSVTIQKK